VLDPLPCQINGTPSGPGIHRGPGDHYGTSRPTERLRRVQRTEGGIRTDTGGTHAGGTVLTANSGGADGVCAPTTNHNSAAADHRSTDNASPASSVRLYPVRATDTDSDERTGRGQDVNRSTRDRRGPSARTGRHDPGRTAIWRGSPQLANALTLAARVAPAAPQAPEDKGQNFPDSPNFSGSDQTQLRSWITQLWIVIRHKPASFPDKQSKMRYALNRLRGIASGQILPYVREDGTIGLEDLPAFIQLLEAAFGDPDRVVTVKRKMREIRQKNREFSQYYAEFLVIAADLDWNPSALQNALRMGLSEKMKDSFKSSDMPDELPTFVMVCQKPDNQIRQRLVEKAT